MAKIESVYNASTHVTNESMSDKKVNDMKKEGREKVALAIGRQMLKRDLIKIEIEENPGANAGERKITVKGVARVEKPAL